MGTKTAVGPGGIVGPLDDDVAAQIAHGCAFIQDGRRGQCRRGVTGLWCQAHATAGDVLQFAPTEFGHRCAQRELVAVAAAYRQSLGLCNAVEIGGCQGDGVAHFPVAGAVFECQDRSTHVGVVVQFGPHGLW